MMNLPSAMALGDSSSLWCLVPKLTQSPVSLKLEFRGGILGLPASSMTCSIEAEKPPNRTTELQPVNDQADGSIVRKLNKDMASFHSKFCFLITICR